MKQAQFYWKWFNIVAIPTMVISLNDQYKFTIRWSKSMTKSHKIELCVLFNMQNEMFSPVSN